MNEKEKTAKAVEDYNNFLTLHEKEDNAAVYDLLKQIDFRLVKKHYRNFEINPKEEPRFNLIKVMAEMYKLKDEYKKYRADGGKAMEFFEGLVRQSSKER